MFDPNTDPDFVKLAQLYGTLSPQSKVICRRMIRRIIETLAPYKEYTPEVEDALTREMVNVWNDVEDLIRQEQEGE